MMARNSLLVIGIGLLFLGAPSWILAAEPEGADESKLTITQKVDLYISQLANLECQEVHTTEGSYIIPYVAKVAGEFDKNPATEKLRRIGMAAVPALVKALDDDTPTKTTEGFGEKKEVWRVSDFAWVILRVILSRDFTEGGRYYRGPYSMTEEVKQQTFKRLKEWYAKNKGRSRNEQWLSYFSSPNPTDWFTAGKYFAKRQDKQAVEPLLANIRTADSRTKGALCQLVARFKDPRAIDVLKQVMKTAEDPTDRVHAAFALGSLGDNSGVPTVIQYLSEEKSTSAMRDELLWFLMHTHTKEGIAALDGLLSQADTIQAGEILESISNSIAGNVTYQPREPAGSTEILPLLVDALNRSKTTFIKIDNVPLRVKDQAALAILLLKDGNTDALFGDEPTDDLFNPAKMLPVKQRDLRIEQLKAWYKKHQGQLVWDVMQKKLVVKQD